MQFFVVYIKEAHAIDSERPITRPGSPLVQEPITMEERREVAGQCATAMEIKDIPTLIDRLDDGVARSYAAWPDRLFLVGRDGRIAFSGGPGPFGFKPDELEAAIKKELAAAGR